MKYNQTDHRNKILNPTDKREKIFKEHFPGDEFINVFDFFLRTYEDLNNAMSILQLMKMKETRKTMEKQLEAVRAYKIQNGMIGRITSMFYRKSSKEM